MIKSQNPGKIVAYRSNRIEYELYRPISLQSWYTDKKYKKFISSFVKRIKYMHGTFTNSFIITPLKQKSPLLIINLLLLTVLIRKMGNNKTQLSREDHQEVRKIEYERKRKERMENEQTQQRLLQRRENYK